MGNKERENGNRLSSHGLAALIVDALVDAGLVVLQQHLAPNVAEFARIQFRFIKRNARIRLQVLL